MTNFVTYFLDEIFDEIFAEFFDDFWFFGRFFFTYNLLTIASFRIVVPLILFFDNLAKNGQKD